MMAAGIWQNKDCPPLKINSPRVRGESHQRCDPLRSPSLALKTILPQARVLALSPSLIWIGVRLAAILA